jgi:hypothetical protein
MSAVEGRGISEAKTDRSSKLGSSPFWSQKCSVPFERGLLVFHASLSSTGLEMPLQWQRERTNHQSGRVDMPEPGLNPWRPAARFNSYTAE